MKYSGNSIGTVGQSLGMSMHPDGTKLYVTIHNGDYISQYAMSKAYDLTTASFISNSLNINQGGESSARGHFISPDGLKMYICGSSTAKVLQYALATAWNVNTASYVSSFASSAAPIDMAISPDGIYMILRETNSITRRYTLSTAWDVTTAVLSQTMTQALSFTGLYFSTDGKRFFGTNTNTIHKYYLGTAWDLLTYSIMESLDITSLEVLSSSFDDVAFSSNGLFLYTSHYNGAMVKRMELKQPFFIKGKVYYQPQSQL
ncbi:YncE family protein [Flavobacterium sp. RSP29]|uniref:YncE family protein n=1 Tax=Flavobacterium sp. RSP29 TaxID=3401731 RepID=UPI003AB0FB32